MAAPTETEQAGSTPQVKFEASPAESVLSVPGDMYPSLFASTSTMNPLESVMTPGSFSTVDDDKVASLASPVPESSPAPESKTSQPVKKRKSWGQELPQPKTNLPPRKRAKTEDEKEQRRVERVLRNRRAAQSSRERKRQEVEALEQRNQSLEEALLVQRKTNMRLMEELDKLRRSSGVYSRSASPLDAIQPSPLTLSQPLFGASTDGAAESHSGTMNEFILMPEQEQDGTVDPASLSPELNPVSDNDVSKSTTEIDVAKALAPAAASSDETQHPAAVLCDQQCPSVEVPQPWIASRQPSPPALRLLLQLQTVLMASSAVISACQSPLTLITGALKTNLALVPTPSILSTIIWLVTLPPNIRRSTTPTTSTSSSAMMSAVPLQARPREATRSPKSPTPSSAPPTLRIKSLQKLLTSSPFLARPLQDATMGFLRLVSEGREDRVEELAIGSPGIKGDQSRGPHLLWPEGTSLPSNEVLLTLLWAIRVEERQLSRENRTTVSSPSSRPGFSVLHEKTSTQTNVLSASASAKRKSDLADLSNGKRSRLSF
ncbi:hypothetical protein F4780DRAFT_398071 [Xylariomycetidae sp. FL0641]|nr:hypothetical protein F4780DRAFT_398071 [Xylariomycetidae sp. FL0641]